METSWTTGVGDGGVAGDDSRRQNIDVTNNNWDVCNISTHTPANTPYDWSNPARVTEASVVHALLFGVTGNSTFNGAGVESNSVHRRFPDPHMMCLKLGKRHYCEDSSESSTTSKRGKLPYPVSPAPVVVPRCQVEGCHVALGGAKDYYKKHKVCELHSKAPNVVVSGVHQRFCQQCSRFHGVTEFDESKRSCRRRLKGHNQRRRKRTDSIKIGPSKPAGRAYSFLSSPATQPSGDFSSRCSVALYELIAANRATSGNLLNQNANQHQPVSDDSINLRMFPDTQMCDRFGHTPIVEAPALEFGLLTVKEKSKDPEDWTDYCWSSYGGANVV